MGAKRAYNRQSGFTLIELSIVLVIIGLIVGGVLAGQNLVSAAAVRAQVSQIEKFNTAANTFREKYGGLPGDISAALVTQFAFSVVPNRAGTAGLGDGNGVIEGYDFNSSVVKDDLSSGEAAWFWEDLTSNSHLIPGAFNTAQASTGYQSSVQLSPKGVLPEAALGNGIYLYVYALNGVNFFSISTVLGMNIYGGINNGAVALSNPGLTVQQAYAIDSKVDDGAPQTGNVIAKYLNWRVLYAPMWASGGGVAGPSGTAATASSASTCYDNGGTAGQPQQYSVEISNGANVNCALSFKMQAGD